MANKRIPLYLQILIGMIAGVLIGLCSVQFGFQQLTLDWIKPFGTIFMKMLKMIAMPLVLASLVTGVASLKDINKLSRIGGKTFVLYLSLIHI